MWHNKGKTASKEMREKLKLGQQRRRLRDGYVNSPEAISKRNSTIIKNGGLHSKEHIETCRQRWLGSNNPNWTGTASLHVQVRSSEKYKTWRLSIFRRDSYTCMCGNTGKIVADHIKPFSLIMRQNYIETLSDAMLCEELWNINNGRTLCEGCHKITPTFLSGSRKKSVLSTFV